MNLAASIRHRPTVRAPAHRRCWALFLIVVALPAGATETLRPRQGSTLSGAVSLPGLMRPTDVVIYLEASGGRGQPEQAPPNLVAQIDQRGLRFRPHVLVVPVGTVVDFTNSDDVLHNIFAPGLGGEAFDLGTWPKGDRRSHRFERPGVSVLLCNVHPEMEAYIVVVPTTLYTISNDEGAFQIEDLSPGTYTLHAWHERCVPLEQRLDVPADSELWIELTLELPSTR